MAADYRRPRADLSTIIANSNTHLQPIPSLFLIYPLPTDVTVAEPLILSLFPAPVLNIYPSGQRNATTSRYGRTLHVELVCMLFSSFGTENYWTGRSVLSPDYTLSILREAAASGFPSVVWYDGARPVSSPSMMPWSGSSP